MWPRSNCWIGLHPQARAHSSSMQPVPVCMEAQSAEEASETLSRGRPVPLAWVQHSDQLCSEGRHVTGGGLKSPRGWAGHRLTDVGVSGW